MPHLLAPWQRALLWLVWLGAFVVVWLNTDRDSLGLKEVAALAAAIGVTVWVKWHPAGGPAVEITDPNDLRGEFVSRPSWAWLLVGVWLCLGGIAFGVRLVRDLSSGLATPYDVLVDVVRFFTEWITERLSGGVHGDVTNTRLYVMVVLLPMGLMILLFQLPALLWRGRRFRVDDDGSLHAFVGGTWEPLRVKAYGRIVGDGITIDFREEASGRPDVSLPQMRVYSALRGTRVSPRVLAGLIRQKAAAAGMEVAPSLVKGETRAAFTASRSKDASKPQD